MTFSSLSLLPLDPILAVSEKVRADPRTEKADLGVGVYRDAKGNTPIFSAVKAAEKRLFDQQASKAYLGPEGDQGFVRAIASEAFGAAASRVRGVQTVGGTGALRLAAQLLVNQRADRRVWIGQPAWSNYRPLFADAGLAIAPYDLPADPSTGAVKQAMLDAIAEAGEGDVMLLQGCCHNPTGFDPDKGDWQAIVTAIRDRGLVALVDTAYQGLGSGWDEDGEAMRVCLDILPEVLIAYSCDKNFGLYRDRVGALFFGGSDAVAEAIYSHMVAGARSTYSMPPDHGAAVVRLVLEDAALHSDWREELDRMCRRIAGLRAMLVQEGDKAGLDLTALGSGKGMFTMLSLSSDQIGRLARDHAVYIAPNGRMNIAGLTEDGIASFVYALSSVRQKAVA